VSNRRRAKPTEPSLREHAPPDQHVDLSAYDVRPDDRRRARDERERIFTLIAELDYTEPAVARRLELSSHLTLDRVHSVLQAAFGWTDSHLHLFASGDSVWDRAAIRYLCPFDVEEGEFDGVPEEEVRLDEVLGEPGDILRYAYDYGDGWEVTVHLEAVTDTAPARTPAACTGGRRAAPPDDCGGIPGFEELIADGRMDADAFDVTAVDAAVQAALQRV
jgi:hypothetical protein